MATIYLQDQASRDADRSRINTEVFIEIQEPAVGWLGDERKTTRRSHDELCGYLLMALEAAGFRLKVECPVRCSWGIGYIDVAGTLGEFQILFEVKSEHERGGIGEAVRQLRQYKAKRSEGWLFLGWKPTLAEAKLIEVSGYKVAWFDTVWFEELDDQVPPQVKRKFLGLEVSWLRRMKGSK